MQKFRIWYIPQVPWRPFQEYADTKEEWIKLLQTVIKFSIFEFSERIKPDYSDASGMEYFYTDEQSIEYADEENMVEEIDGVRGVWLEWYDDEWNDVDEYINL